MTVNKNSKCVFVIDASLPVGLVANTAAVLATALTSKVQDLVGWDVADAAGYLHPAITRVGLPMLRASVAELATLHDRAREANDLLVAGFSDVAQQSRSYDAYASRMAGLDAGGLRFLGIALFGHRERVSELTGHLDLM